MGWESKGPKAGCGISRSLVPVVGEFSHAALAALSPLQPERARKEEVVLEVY
jgi:hypothetical protein